jgi:hypothetical protein
MTMSATVKEYRMNHTATKALNVLLKSAALCALLFATSIHAGSRDSTASGAIGYGQVPGGADRGRSVQGLGSNDAFERQKFSSRTPSAVKTGNSKKVYLEDYQRVPQAVGRKHPTQPHVLGQGKRRQ